jgi:WD40 repeat protein/tetratricopeptide (TPR) repeat protein
MSPSDPSLSSAPPATGPEAEPLLQQLADAWRAGQQPDLDSFLAAAGPRRADLILELIGTDLEGRLRAGEAARVETYLTRYPELTSDPSAVLRLLGLEYRLRRAQEPELAPAEYLQRFPALREALPAALDSGAPGERTLADTCAFEPATQAPPPAGGEAPLPPAPVPEDVRYRPKRFHARGGLGEVFVAEDDELHREVALKRIQEQHAGNPDSRRRFLREAEITARLEHPGVVPVHGLVEGPDGQPCYAMRFIEGETLHGAIRHYHQHLESGGEAGEQRLQLRQLLTRFITVCDTLAYAHSRGVIHRDLKPGNIMLGKYGETLVVDWGLAKALHEDDAGPMTAAEPESPTSEPDGERTRMGQALGTPAYMSPEQAAGRLDQLGPASDIYSLGATLYCLLTGKAPFQDRNLSEVLKKVQAGEFPRPRTTNRHVPAPLDAICVKAMARRPEDRYASPRALAGDLERWLADEPCTAYREPWRQRLARWARRHRTAVTAAGVALALLLAGAVGGLLLWESGEQRRREQAQKYLIQARSAAEADERLALAEVQAGRFASAEQILGQAGQRLRDQPDLADLHSRLQARHDRVGRLVRCYALIDQVERRTFYHQYRDAWASAEEALTTLDIARHPDWWDHLPDAELTPGQRAGLRNDGYRLVLLAGGLRALEGLTHFGSPKAKPPLNAALELIDQADRFRPSRAAATVKRFCHFGLGQWGQLKATPDAEPTSAVDYYLMGLLHLAIQAEADHPISKRLRAGPAVLLRGLDFKTPEATAERYLRSAAELDPRHYFHHLFLSNALRFRNQSQAAELAVSACLALRPDDPIGYEMRAATLRDQYHQSADPGQKARFLERTLADYNKAIQVAPTSTVTLNNRGLILLEKGELDGAIADFHAVLRAGPRKDVVYANLGEAYRRKGDFDEAVPAFTALIERDGKVAVLWAERARWYARRRQWDRAAADLAQAVQLDPGNAGFRCLHAGALVRAGDLETYRGACRRMLERFQGTKQPNDAALIARACVEAPLPAADVARAVRLAERAAALVPSANWAHTILGAAYYRAGQYGKAVAALQESLRIAPSWPAANYPANSAPNWPLLAMAHHRLGQDDQATFWLDRAVAWSACERGERPEEVFEWPINIWWDGVHFENMYAEAKELLRGAPRPPVEIFAVRFSPDGNTLIAGGGLPEQAGEIQWWDPGTGALRRRLRQPLGIHYLALTSDGKTLVTADYYARAAKVRDAATGKVLRVLAGHKHSVGSVAVSPSGKLVATVSERDAVLLWDLESGKKLRAVRNHPVLWRVGFSRDGRTLVSIGGDGMVRLWDIATGRERFALQAHPGGVQCAAFSPDDSILATAGRDRTVKLWKTADGTPLATLEGHRLKVLCVAFSPDGKILASSSGAWGCPEVPGLPSELKLWDVGTRKEVADLRGHRGNIVTVAFSPDGKVLASGSWDKTIKLWDVASHKELRTLQPPRSPPQAPPPPKTKSSRTKALRGLAERAGSVSAGADLRPARLPDPNPALLQSARERAISVTR